MHPVATSPSGGPVVFYWLKRANRTVTLEFKEAGLKAAVFGQTSGRVNFDPRSGWDEVHFQLPADLIREGANRITLTGRYAAFHYWFYQQP